MRRVLGGKGLVSPKAAAYSEHPSDQTSVLAVIVQFEGTSNSSGALHAKRNTVHVHQLYIYSYTHTCIVQNTFVHTAPEVQGLPVCSMDVDFSTKLYKPRVSV